MDTEIPFLLLLLQTLVTSPKRWPPGSLICGLHALVYPHPSLNGADLCNKKVLWIC